MTFSGYLHDLSIRKKLMAMAMLTSITAILLAGLAVTTLSWLSRRQTYTENLAGLTSVIADNCEATLAMNLPGDYTSKVLAALATRSSVRQAQVFNAKGKLVATYSRDGAAGDSTVSTEVPEVGTRLGRGGLIITQPIIREGISLGTISIEDDMQQLERELRLEVTGLAAVMLVALGMATVVASGLQKLIARPILALAGVATKVSEEKSYSERAEPAGADEIGTLISAFNEMLAQIQTRDSALQESEERLRMVIDLLPEMIFVKDRQGRFLLANEAVAQVYETTVNELTGRLQADYHQDPAQLQQMLADDLEVIDSRHSKHISEQPFAAPSGRTLWLQTTKVPMPLPDQEGMGVLGIAIDISERRRVEEELRHLRNYLSNIIDSMPSVLVGVDADGRVTQWNREAERVTGLDAESARGRPLEQAFSRLTAEMERILSAISCREPQHGSKVWIADGETRHENITIYPLVANGVEGAVIRIDDVTERTRIEEMMIQTEKMMSVGGLAAGMAHEINNPLAVIMQSAQNVLRRVSPTLPVNLRVARECQTSLETVRHYLEQREVLEFLDDIRDAGSRAAKIVKNMLSFSRKGGSCVRPENLPELLDRTVELASSDYDLKKKHDFKQIEIIRNYDPELPWVPCEAPKIQQVFLNILKNGAEAMSECRGHGYVPRFILRLDRSDDLAVIEIEDNGPGIDEATRRRVFEPFFTTKDVGAGTGLGLSVSYFIVTEDHGGSMSVESDGCSGTRFIIKLPLSAEAHQVVVAEGTEI